MPMYLKRDTIRLLEASVESISMAVTAIGLPKRWKISIQGREVCCGITKRL